MREPDAMCVSRPTAAGCAGHPRGVDDRAVLLDRYRELVLHELPRRARTERWVVTADHCFGRIVLDHAVGRCWYEVLDRRRSPAFAQLDDARLDAAVRLAERIAAEGDPLLRELDAQSLAWRGKGRSPSGRPSAGAATTADDGGAIR